MRKYSRLDFSVMSRSMVHMKVHAAAVFFWTVIAFFFLKTRNKDDVCQQRERHHLSVYFFLHAFSSTQTYAEKNTLSSLPHVLMWKLQVGVEEVGWGCPVSETK